MIIVYRPLGKFLFFKYRGKPIKFDPVYFAGRFLEYLEKGIMPAVLKSVDDFIAKYPFMAGFRYLLCVHLSMYCEMSGHEFVSNQERERCLAQCIPEALDSTIYGVEVVEN